MLVFCRRAFIVLASLGLTQALVASTPQAQEQKAKDSAPRSAKVIPLIEARQRMSNAKSRLLDDRLLLEKLRPRMNGNVYQTWVLRLNQRERLINAEARKLDDLLRTASQERKVREATGSKFYDDQAAYYKSIYSDDIDMHLD